MLDNYKAFSAKENDNSAIAMHFPAYNKWDIVMLELGQEYDSCVTRGYRPGIVLSSDDYNKAAPIMIVIPLTKKLKGIDKTYHVFVDKEDCVGYSASGTALVEQLRPVDRRFVNRRIGKVTDSRLRRKIVDAVKGFLIEDLP